MEIISFRGILIVVIVCLVTGYGAGSFITGSVNQEIIDDLSASINSIDTLSTENSNRLNMLEQEIQNYQEDLEACKEQINVLQSEASSLNLELYEVHEEISNLLDDIENAENLDNIALVQELEALDYRMDRSEAYRLLRTTMSKPGAYIVDSVTDIIFIELETRYPQISLVEGEIKVIIAKSINAKTPSLVWYGRSCERITSDLYITHVVTYFPLELDLPIVGDIVIARVALVVSGEVDTNQNIVIANSIEVVTITIEE